MDSSLEFNPSCFESSQIWSSQISSVLPLVGEDESDVTAGLMQFGDLLDAEFPHLDKIGIDDRDINFHPFFVGQGTSYKVYASRFTKWDRVVAVKYARVAVRPHSISESQEIVIPDTRQKLTAILQEIYTICWFGYHPNIISLLGWSHEFDDGELTAHLIVEFSSRGSLRRFLQAQNYLDMSICEKFCVDVVRGLSALHEHGVVQGDLKLENILVFEDSDGAPAARISDFGFAIFMEPNKKTYLYHGTSLYNAPEVATQVIRSIPLDELPACDIYSYGLMVWEIFQQGIPYKSECSCNEISSQEAVWTLESTSATGNLELAIIFVEKLVDAHLREILALVFEATLPPKPLQRKSARNVLSLFRGGDHLGG